jgi:sugar/nucleoside kinase (ribokinase family)
MNNIDFLAIGDIAAEPFIRIKDAEINCNLDKENCKLCFNFGNKIPYESAEICYATGNSSNASICASRLGLKSYLITYIGNDNVGKKNIEKLIEEGVQTEFINSVDNLDSNYHYVLWYDTERTILTRHTEFPYSFPKNIPEPKWIYFSSLASNSLLYHNEIASYLNNNPNIKLAFSPGTIQINFGYETLKDIYSRTEVLLCNFDEAKKILDINDNQQDDIATILKQIHELGPKIVVITDNVNGAYSYDGHQVLFMKAYPCPSFIESTGAGDAFSGSFVSALSLDKTISEALMWGSANACSVVSFVGPHKGLLNKEQIEKFIEEHKNDYQPIII